LSGPIDVIGYDSQGWRKQDNSCSELTAIPLHSIFLCTHSLNLHRTAVTGCLTKHVRVLLRSGPSGREEEAEQVRISKKRFITSALNIAWKTRTRAASISGWRWWLHIRSSDGDGGAPTSLLSHLY
jgi:hypothetical protein